MPNVKLGREKRDPVKGLILEYKTINGMSLKDVAKTWGVSVVTCSKRINNEHSDEWLSEAKKLCKKMNIPIEEFRQAVRY